VCSDVLFPFGHLELTAKEEYCKKKNAYEAEKVTFLEAKKALENKIKSLIEREENDLSSISGLELKSIKEKLANLLKNTPPEPILKRYKVSDMTLEKMHEILSQNPGDVLIFRDELMGFLES
jgi:hypothetical protein